MAEEIGSHPNSSLEQARHRRFGHETEQQRRQSDSDLSTGQRVGQLSHRPESRLGAPGADLLDHFLARGCEGELGGDEEPVGDQQNEHPQQGAEVHDWPSGIVMFDPIDPTAVHLDDFEHPPVVSDPVTRLGKAAKLGDDEASQRLEMAVGQHQPEFLLEVVAVDQARHLTLIARLRGRSVGFDRIVLVGDLTEDLLQEILDGDDAGSASVFVDDDRQGPALTLHVDEQLIERARVGDGEGGFGDVADRCDRATLRREP